MTTKIAKKLSTKVVIGNIKEIRKIAETAEGQTVAIMRVAGIANKIETGESDNGAWTAFKGSFEFTNLTTGEIHVGGRAFIPSPVQDMLEAQLQNSDAVEFAFDVTVIEAPESAVGYEYGAETVLKVEENDPMELLRAKMNKAKPLQIAKAKK